MIWVYLSFLHNTAPMNDNEGFQGSYFNTLRTTNVPKHSYTDTGLTFSCCACQC